MRGIAQEVPAFQRQCRTAVACAGFEDLTLGQAKAVHTHSSQAEGLTCSPLQACNLSTGTHCRCWHRRRHRTGRRSRRWCQQRRWGGRLCLHAHVCLSGQTL